jgi:hypothetical protein
VLTFVSTSVLTFAATLVSTFSAENGLILLQSICRERDPHPGILGMEHCNNRVGGFVGSKCGLPGCKFNKEGSGSAHGSSYTS